MTSLARQSNNRQAIECMSVDDDYVACDECDASGQDWYGRCQECEGVGYVLSDEALGALDRAIVKQPHAWRSM